MNMYFIRLLLLLLLCNVQLFFAQENPVLFEPILAINYDVNERYAINFSIGSRSFLWRNNNVVYAQRQLELNHFSTLRIDPFKSISLGIKVRNRDWFEHSSNELRITQQFNLRKPLERGRFGHRFRIEQRFFEDITMHRFRYRFAYDAPLDGTQLDIGEAYIVAYTESLQSFGTKNNPETEQRFSVQIGWAIAARTKLQLGIEQRLADFWNKAMHSTFILSQLTLKL